MFNVYTNRNGKSGAGNGFRFHRNNFLIAPDLGALCQKFTFTDCERDAQVVVNECRIFDGVRMCWFTRNACNAQLKTHLILSIVIVCAIVRACVFMRVLVRHAL